MFESGFKEVHKGLKSGKYRLIKFKEAHVSQGRYFLEDGVLVYIASLDRKSKNRHGRNDSRTRCIYENGMESGIYMQTLCKNLYSSGYSVQDMSSVEDDYLSKSFAVAADDVESGLIYVLRSLSKDPEIAAISNLYKIGFTTIPLEVRIANAKNEPTYLCSDVEVVATWRVYNVKSSVFEALIHKLFDGVRLQINIDGKTPKEWFVVPLSIIEQAIKYIIKNAAEIGLKIKENWFTRKISWKDRKHETDFIDMMGIRIYRTHLTIRKRVFKRIRRVCIRLYRFWKLHQKIPIHLARKAISYYGLIKNTNSYKIKKKYHVNKIIQLSKGVIRNESTFYVGAAFCQSY